MMLCVMEEWWGVSFDHRKVDPKGPKDQTCLHEQWIDNDLVKQVDSCNLVQIPYGEGSSFLWVPVDNVSHRELIIVRKLRLLEGSSFHWAELWYLSKTHSLVLELSSTTSQNNDWFPVWWPSKRGWPAHYFLIQAQHKEQDFLLSWMTWISEALPSGSPLLH